MRHKAAKNMRRNRMKIKVILSLLLAFALPIIGYASGGSVLNALSNSNCLSWYCKKSESGNPPPLPSEFSFIKEYGGYYLDEDATDDDKVIYLTFDCGYENGNIEKILDTLKRHDASGAFFVLKNLIKKNPELVTRMVNEGHLVCNHTSNHKDMTKMASIEDFKSELDELNGVMLDTVGHSLCPFYRPPEGKFNLENLKWASDLGYKTIFWSCAYDDWDNNRQMSSDKAMNKLMSRLHNGEVLLLHPTSSTNAAILDEFLTTLEDMGYRFGNLYELTGNSMIEPR